jgi:hypothetical protein
MFLRKIGLFYSVYLNETLLAFDFQHIIYIIYLVKIIHTKSGFVFFFGKSTIEVA